MRGDRWLDHTGLNLIRIVIGSYFMAIALGLIAGVAPAAMFAPLVPAPLPDLIGTMLLFSLAVAFMSGLWLRITALSLALFVLSSSVVQNYMLTSAPATASFWRDLALVCAVMLCYSALHRREVRKAALILRRGVQRVRRADDTRIAPRRISRGNKHPVRARRRDGTETMVRPMIAPPAPVADQTPALPARPAEPRGATRAAEGEVEGDHRDDDIDNIFARI